MTTSRQNLKVSEDWERLYNEDADRMALECYAEDCIAFPMGGGAPIEGQAALRKVEEIVSKAAPRRFIRVNHRHEAGDVIVVEATLLDPEKGDDWQIPFVAVLNFEDGKIAVDRTYADWRNWPGFA